METSTVPPMDGSWQGTTKTDRSFSGLDFFSLGVGLVAHVSNTEAYFVGVVVVALVAMCRINRGTANGYFLAGRFMTWLPIGASLFASNIGSEHFIGLAGSGAAAGIAVGAFEFNAGILLQLLGWVFLPVYIASRVMTLPNYMMKRFGSQRICLYLTVLSLMLYVFTKVSVNLYCGIIFIRESLGWGQWIALIVLLAVSGFCTITGGLGAVMYTETLQAAIMVTGASIVAIIAFIRVGGYNSLIALYPQAIPAGRAANYNATECNLPKHDAFRMLRGVDDSEMPWLGFVFGQTPTSIWYWAADQMMVQRTLAAKSLSHAQGGCILASFLKLLPLFMMVLPGMISRVLDPNDIACADPEYCQQVCGNPSGCSDVAYPRLLLRLLPQGARGLMLAVMLSALMSDLTSVFNSASTLFTMDIYTKIRRTAQRRELMLVGRAFVVLMVTISVLWIPVISAMQGGQMYIYIQAVSGYLAPPIAGVYLCAILWPRCNEKGAFWALLTSTFIGVARMIADFSYHKPRCGIVDERPWFIKDIHYMYVAMILFWVTIIICVVVSLLTKPLSEEHLIRTTFFTRHDTRPRSDEQHDPAMSSRTAKDAESLPPSIADGGGELNTKKIMPVLYENPGDKIHMETFGVDDSRPSTATLHMGTESPVHFVGANGVGSDDADNKLRSRKKPGFPSKAARTGSRALVWFCGLDASEADVLREEEQVKNIASLKQNPRARIVLGVFTVFLMVITVCIYSYFSLVPPLIHPVPLEQGGQQSSYILSDG